MTEASVSSKEHLLHQSLAQFFAQPTCRHQLRAVLSGHDPFRVSLRVLDFLVTKYALTGDAGSPVKYKLPVIDPCTGHMCGERLFDLHAQYTAYLKGNPKTIFDPFCRGAKLLLCDESPYLDTMESGRQGTVTNIRQLNFFRWALENGVIDYARLHIRDIEHAMTRVKQGNLTTESPRSTTPSPAPGTTGGASDNPPRFIKGLFRITFGPAITPH